MTAVSRLRYALGPLLLMLMTAWSIWLFGQRKTLGGYMLDAANGKPTLPACQWIPVYSPGLVTTGFSRQGQSWWTNEKKAVMAFRATEPFPSFVEIGIVAVAGDGVALSADDGAFQSIATEPLPNGKLVRLPLSAGTPAGAHVVVIDIAQPRTPRGADERWLGVAINKIRVCRSERG